MTRYILAGILLAACLALPMLLIERITWDASFRQAEFEIHIQTKDGRPVDGCKLRVEDEGGDRAYYYPVTDYTPLQEVCSDSRGVMKFHHVSSKAPEFASRIE